MEIKHSKIHYNSIEKENNIADSWWSKRRATMDNRSIDILNHITSPRAPTSPRITDPRIPSSYAHSRMHGAAHLLDGLSLSPRNNAEPNTDRTWSWTMNSDRATYRSSPRGYTPRPSVTPAPRDASMSLWNSSTPASNEDLRIAKRLNAEAIAAIKDQPLYKPLTPRPGGYPRRGMPFYCGKTLHGYMNMEGTDPRSA